MKTKKYIYILLYSLVIIINIFKCFKGAGFEDEYLYTISGYRLFQGDALMFDEVNNAMFMSLFTYPLVSIFMFLTHSTNGIILYMRFCYVLFTTITSFIFFIRFKHKGDGVIFGSIIYLLLTPYNIMALSYNTLGLGFILLAVCSIPKEINSAKITNFIPFGILYSCAVLNSPLLSIVYIVSIIILIIKSKSKPFYKNFIKGSFLGVLISVVLLFCFVLSRTSFTNMMESLPFIIDSSHNHGVVWQFFASVKTAIDYFGLFLFIAVIYLGYIAFHKKADGHYIYIYSCCNLCFSAV